ncbi:hypothetical protein [Nocardia niwae]|uniref:DUF3558 domain-containing protein n=1 Tax=Nocardia niwae TaxID=626084 RepID=A0ABV2XBL5_9NOCA
MAMTVAAKARTSQAQKNNGQEQRGILEPDTVGPSDCLTTSMTTSAFRGAGLSGFARVSLAVITRAAAALAITGCSESHPNAAQTPAPATTTASALVSATPAAPSLSPISGLDVCALLTSDEVFGAVGKQGLAPHRTTDEKDGRVVAESCIWDRKQRGWYR